MQRLPRHQLFVSSDRVADCGGRIMPSPRRSARSAWPLSSIGAMARRATVVACRSPGAAWGRVDDSRTGALLTRLDTGW